MRSKNIAIFQYEWPLQMHTMNLIKMLAKEGYCVDIFFYNNISFIEIDELDEKDNLISFYVFDNKGQLEIRNKSLNGTKHEKNNLLFKLKFFFQKSMIENNYFQKLLFIINSEKWLINRSILEESNDIIRDKQYRCFIGIEKKALIWSGYLSEIFKTPLIYYNLELYTKDHQYCNESYNNLRIKMKEEYYHQRCCATIIQDEMRADVLYNDNHVSSRHVRIIYLPVSNIGKCIKRESNYLFKKHNINKYKNIILYYGSIGKSRRIHELIKSFNRFPLNYKLILHGVITSETKSFFDENANTELIALSTDLISSVELIELIKSASIGLAVYGDQNLNDQLTAFSSEKISTFLQCGIPIIAFKYPGYEIFEKYNCGILIQSYKEMKSAVDQIMSNYQYYQNNAYRCFEKEYNYENNFVSLKKYIQNLDLEC